YYDRFYIGTFLRVLRYFLAGVALLGPAFYIAVTTFHQEMLPTALLVTLAATREGIPFPSLIEAFMMEIAFEALREAGVRLPRTVGQAVSIVGALVIGQSAVQAGIISAPMVIVVATTGIASFTFPRFSLGIAIRLLRFLMMGLAAFLGLYGIMIGLLLVLVHLSGLRSLGIPYLSPVAPLTLGDLADVAVRPPTWLRGLRPRMTGYPDPRRQGRRIKPGPEPWEEGEGTEGGREADPA
ncbi:MAG TPA: spore germination protein, partial [Bacillota bacterium]